MRDLSIVVLTPRRRLLCGLNFLNGADQAVILVVEEEVSGDVVVEVVEVAVVVVVVVVAVVVVVVVVVEVMYL